MSHESLSYSDQGMEAQLKNVEQFTLGSLGVVDRKHGNLGLTTAPVSIATNVDPRSGDRLYALNIAYPINGLGLEHFLSVPSPGTDPETMQIRRFATLIDWSLPDTASPEDSPDDYALYLAHKDLPGFKEFDRNHKRRWLKVGDEAIGDEFFVWRDKTRYVDAQKFVHGHNYLYGDTPVEKLFLSSSTMFIVASELYNGRIGDGSDKHKPRSFVDPVRGIGAERYVTFSGREGQLNPIFDSQGKDITTTSDGITARIQLGDADENGYYAEKSVQMEFSPEYQDGSLNPLIVWREHNGERTFLSQYLARKFFPELAWPNGADVVLGRVAAAYFQPDVSLPARRGIQSIGKNNDMGPAQMPVLVSMPGIAQKLLDTDFIRSLEESMQTMTKKDAVVENVIYS